MTLGAPRSATVAARHDSIKGLIEEEAMELSQNCYWGHVDYISNTYHVHSTYRLSEEY